MSVAVVNHDGSANFSVYSDSGIKLFGKDIPLKQEPSEEPSTISTVQVSSHQDDHADSLPQIQEYQEAMEIITCKSENSSCVEVGNSSVGSSSMKTEQASAKCGFSTDDNLHKVEDVHGTIITENTSKKPDKLIPCPRCNSLDTKFCYYNNYNVNQPRHFCRKCQRYWTAGGTLRNVPVGAGRRKNKHSVLNHKHSMVSGASPVCRSTADAAGYGFESLKSPLCRNIAATTLSMEESAILQEHGGVHAECGISADGKLAAGGSLTSKLEDCNSSVKIVPASCNALEVLSAPSVAGQLQEARHAHNASCGTHQAELGETSSSTVHGATWQPGNNVICENPLNNATVPLTNCENSSTPSLSVVTPNIWACNGVPGGFWPGLPWPLLNPSIWPWTMPFYPPGASAAAGSALPRSFAESAPRKRQITEQSQPEKRFWVPKTLRIDDPLNTACSSIWTTLGLGDGPLSSPACGPTSAFQLRPDLKDDNVNEVVSTNRFSNPAALSRSAAFQECS